MFIKLTNANKDYAEFYIDVDLIEEFHLYGRYTILDLKDRRYTVKETPEEIIKLIEEEK